MATDDDENEREDEASDERDDADEGSSGDDGDEARASSDDESSDDASERGSSDDASERGSSDDESSDDADEEGAEAAPAATAKSTKKSKPGSAGARLAAAKAAKAAKKAAKKAQVAAESGTGAGAIPRADEEAPVEALKESAIGKAAVKAGEWADANRSIALAVAAALVLSVVGVGGWMWWSNRQAQAAGVALAAALRIASAEIVAPVETPEGEDPPAAPTTDEDDDDPTFETAEARREAALEAFRVVSRDFGGTPGARWARLGEARMLLEGGSRDEARAAFQRALDEAGDDPTVALRALEGIAFTHEAAGELEQARDRFEEIGRIEDRAFAPISRYHLARLAMGEGDRVGATTALRELTTELREADAEEGGVEFPYVLAQAQARLAELDPSTASSAGADRTGRRRPAAGARGHRPRGAGAASPTAGRRRRRRGRGVSRALIPLGACLALGCAGLPMSAISYDRAVDDTAGGTSAGRVTLRWTQRLARDLEGAYLPVERSIPALDPLSDRIYVGSSTGDLWALTGAGARVYTYHTRGAIGSQPLVDRGRDELFVGSDDGLLHALVASTGEPRWTAEIGAAIGRAPAATDDTVYVITDSDLVAAFARDTGETLWRYRRDAAEGFYVTEHAGITLAGDRILTAFTDGMVVALDAADGRVLWERDTSADITNTTDAIRFTDVDTTPVVIDDKVYVASFAGGMYELELSSGSVSWLRETLTGVIGIARGPAGTLILSSGDLGVVAIDRTGETRWTAPVLRGAPSTPMVVGDLVLYGESGGGLIALSIASGAEVARIENGHGFSAPPSVEAGIGAAVSNAGALFVFAVH